MNISKPQTSDVNVIKSSNQFPVVGIGASAGGLNAFKALLNAIPEHSGMAFVLVQHLDPRHESMLTELLQKVTSIPVLEISDDIKVQPDHIYIIPSNKMLVANDGVLLLSPRSTNKNEINLPIDLFFKSLAEVHQSYSIGVVLSGTGSDGTKGLKAIKDFGGITFAQDMESAEYDGMPHSAMQAGVVDFDLPPELIPQKLLELAKITHGNGTFAGKEDSDITSLPQQYDDVFRQILAVLRLRKGTDFTYYKQTTIRRRILRRVALNKNEDPRSYLDYLREHKLEQDVLYQDLLISVTSFFRDPKTFDHLCETIFPEIVKSKKEGESVRIWVTACSTGQEAYSIAMCLREYLGDQQEKIQIFATDISEPAIAKARSGNFEKSELEGISDQRLKEFFTKTNGLYQINKSIRDLCVFAAHNFLKDPPFGKIDLISCRNVLIYMEPYLQRKALSTFHYALNPKGYLLLGKSETISSVPELFASVVKNDKLFVRKDVPGKFVQVASQRSEQSISNMETNVKTEIRRTDFQKTADDILLSKYTPAGVVVNEELDIVHFRGRTGDYLEQFPGKPSHNLLKMARNGLAFELRNILHKAKKGGTTVVKENIPVEINGVLKNITIEALILPDTIEPHYLVLFHENQSQATSHQPQVRNKKTLSNGTKLIADSHIEQLERELYELREDMRSITEDQEAVNEELQSANEELLSGSEELQSLNEELETGKEELQSSNEELTVVHQEMLGLNEKVSAARDYAEAVITTIRESLLVLDRNLRVKSANKAFYKTFRVNELETEGRLVYQLGDDQWNIPELRTMLEEILPKKNLFSDFEITCNFPNIGERVMVLNAREITGVKIEEKLILLAIEDVTVVRKKAAELLAIEKKYLSRFQNLLMQTPVGIIAFRGNDYIVELANDLVLKIFVKDKSIIGKPLFESMLEIKGQMKPILDAVMQSGVPFYGNEQSLTIFRNGKNDVGFFNFVYEPVREDDKTISGIITAIYEVTEQVNARKKLEESEERFQAAVSAVGGIVWTNNEKGEMEGEQLGWNSITGQTYEEYQGYGWADAIHPDDVKPTIEAWTEAIKDRKDFVFEHSVKLKNGRWGYFSVKAIPLLNEDKSIREWVGVHTDISRRKQSEISLEESEAFSRTVLENSPDCVKLIDAEGRIQFMNSNGLCILEIDDFNAIKNKPWTELWGAENRHLVSESIFKAFSGETVHFQAFCPTFKGTPRWWDVMISPVFEGNTIKVSSLISVSRDISEQKEIQSLLEYRKALLEAHNEASDDGILLVDPKGKIISYNKRFLDIWNMPKHIIKEKDEEKALAFAMTQLVHPEQFLEKVNHLRENPQESSIDEFEYIDGKIIERRGYSVVASDGNYYARSWIFRDITKAKNAESTLRQSEENFRQLAELMPEKVNHDDAYGNTIYFNQNWLDYTGLSSEELLKLGKLKLIHPDELEEVTLRWLHSIKTGDDFEMEMRIRDVNGNYIWHLSRSKAIKNDAGTPVKWIGTTTQIQKLKEHEQRKSDFLKMVSHELKTPVTSIKGYVQFLSKLLSKEQEELLHTLPLRSSLMRIDSQIGRLTRLITELLDLSRIEESKLELQMESFNLCDLVNEVAEDVHFSSPKYHIIVSGEKQVLVLADRDRIGQVIINFITNAIKYSPSNNTIEVKVQKVSESNVSVNVKDYGIGIDKQDQEKIFERFYRVEGKSEQRFGGFGIGLYVAAEIIKRHGGSVSVESEKGKGSVFSFILPFLTE